MRQHKIGPNIDSDPNIKSNHVLNVRSKPNETSTMFLPIDVYFNICLTYKKQNYI